MLFLDSQVSNSAVVDLTVDLMTKIDQPSKPILSKIRRKPNLKKGSKLSLSTDIGKSRSVGETKRKRLMRCRTCAGCRATGMPNVFIL